MAVIAILISILCAFLIGIFLYLFLMRAILFWCRGTARIKLKQMRIFAIAASICIALFSVNLFSTAALVILHIVVFALAMELINLPVRLISGKIKRNPETWNKIYKCGLVPVFITALLLSYGSWNINNVKETYYTVYTHKAIPAAGYRVLLIADLHYGNAAHFDDLERYCTQMSAEKPDIVVLCGDIVDESTERAELEEAMRLLGSIQNKYGIFYVFGNHDKSRYRSAPNYTEEELRAAIRENNIHLLEDASYEIDGNFTLIGRKDRSNARESVEEITAETDPDRFLLMLDHQPTEYEEERAAGVDLLLSGHTHAGQIWPVGYLIEPLGFGDLCYGYEKNGSLQAIVTSGISAWGYPVRTQGHSEFVIIDIVGNP